MSSLAQSREIVGFFSYSRNDEDAKLSALRNAICRELSLQLGRPKSDVRIFQTQEASQDQESTTPGQVWKSEIAKAVKEASFFIPILTPSATNSQHCKFEFNLFVDRERALGRTDLVFPIYYVVIPALRDDKWRNDPLLSAIGKRQYEDCLHFRHAKMDEPSVTELIERFCAKIVEALSQEPLPEKRSRVRKTAGESGSEISAVLEAARKAEAERKYAQALTLYEKAADQGSTAAQTTLGRFYETGRGVKKNYTTARRWYQKAAERGDDRARAGIKRLSLANRASLIRKRQG